MGSGIRLRFAIISFLFIVCFFVFNSNRATSAPPPLPVTPSNEDVRNTKHNFSVVPPDGVVRNIYSTETSEICVFCHTPHGADRNAVSVRAPIWNRSLPNSNYQLYDQVWSFSFEGEMNVGAPTGYSRLCLSCHDGTIAIGSVVNTPGTGTTGTAMNMEYPTGQSPAGLAGTMPVGSGVRSGDTRVLGTDLRNDHPISFIYDTPLAARDTELVDPGNPPARIGDATPISPMRRAEGNLRGVYDSVQCTSCHNPHGVEYPKFLRASIFQNDPPGSQIICLSCHEKAGWVGSTHDISQAVHNPYPTPENPYDYDGEHTVSAYACRNCHDPHTVQGAKKLHREGADFTGTVDTIENTCFLCHSSQGTLLPAGPNTGFANTGATVAPDIENQFAKDANLGGNCDPEGPVCGSAMNVRMAQGHETVFIARSQEGVELFSPNPPINNEASPGNARRDNVHVECVDCHNPHQVVATNRLKGTKGIDINGQVVGAGIAGNDREPYVYEVCLRCHGNSYINMFAGDRFPDDTMGLQVRSNPRSMPINPNFSMSGFSNKRLEFDPNSVNLATFPWSSKNTAYHPVASPGRNGSPQLCYQLRTAFSLSCADPESELAGLTLQCTDCHNSDKTSIVRGPVTESNLRDTDKPSFFLSMKADIALEERAVGPHGSKNIRILRDKYITDIKEDVNYSGRCFEVFSSRFSPKPAGCGSIGDGGNPQHFENFTLCFLCHERRVFDPYMGASRVDSSVTRFFGKTQGSGNPDAWSDNLHMYHLQWTGAYCHECHNNVHSNIEAQNTIYLPETKPPDDTDGMSDGVINTHLINFGPQADYTTYGKPTWKYETNGEFRCYLACHQNTMDMCAYQGISGTSGSAWCAGGERRG